jgi:hypothetical protein
MSELGHERRFGRAKVVSALPPIATKSVQALNAVQGQYLPHQLLAIDALGRLEPLIILSLAQFPHEEPNSPSHSDWTKLI